MDVQKISFVSNAALGAACAKPAGQESVKKEIPDGKKKIALALMGLGALAVAAVGVAAAVRKGKAPGAAAADAATAARNIPVENLGLKDLGRVIQEKGIKFNQGVATLGDNSKFTGTIEGVLNSGDKITLEYKDGKIMSSVSDKFTKTYTYNPGGALNDVKITRPGEMPHYYLASDEAFEKMMQASTEDSNALKTNKASCIMRWEEPNHAIFQASEKLYQIPGAEGRNGIQLIVDKNTGKSVYRQKIVYVDGGKTRKESFFDKDGKLLGVHNYDNGDFTKYNPDGSVMIFEKALRGLGEEFHAKVFELLEL